MAYRPDPLAPDVVDRLFSALVLRYGAPFLDRWRDIDLQVVKDDWARELAGFRGAALRFALDNLPERPPTVMDFRKLANQAPHSAPAASIAHSDRVRGPTPAERDAMRALARDIRRGEFFAKPSRRWAYDLIAAHEAGRREQWVNGHAVWCDFHCTPASLEMAREAIGTDPNRDHSQWDKTGNRITTTNPEEFA